MLTVLSLGERCAVPCTLALGGFDGLHLGHRVLLQRAKRAGTPLAVTTVLGGKGKALFTREEREFLFARAGVGFAVEIPFTEEVKETPAEEFLHTLFSGLDVRLAVCGGDFRFGRGAAGTPALLKALAPCPVETVPVIRSDFARAGEGSARMRKISTSACKRYLAKGELGLLNACLFSDDPAAGYFVQGTVEHGRAEGRKYGFPTLNLRVPEGKILPPDGVYGGTVQTPQGTYPAIVNIGARPTFGIGERMIEAHLKGFSGDLYGAAVRIYPTTFLRPILHFDRVEDLKEQLIRDRERI